MNNLTPKRDVDRLLYPKFRLNPIIFGNILLGLISTGAVVQGMVDLPGWCGFSLLALYLSWVYWFFRGIRLL